MIVKLLTELHLEFLSLKEGCTGASESTHVKMSHCWKSHVTDQSINNNMSDISVSSMIMCRWFIFNNLEYCLIKPSEPQHAISDNVTF